MRIFTGLWVCIITIAVIMIAIAVVIQGSHRHLDYEELDDDILTILGRYEPLLADHENRLIKIEWTIKNNKSSVPGIGRDRKLQTEVYEE